VVLICFVICECAYVCFVMCGCVYVFCNVWMGVGMGFVMCEFVYGWVFYCVGVLTVVWVFC